jgi:hypothetical protein
MEVCFSSPKARRHRSFAAFFKVNRVLLADGTADSTPLATSLIDGDFRGRGAIRYGAKLADTHALSVAVTQVRIDRSHIFCAKHTGIDLYEAYGIGVTWGRSGTVLTGLMGRLVEIEPSVVVLSTV